MNSLKTIMVAVDVSKYSLSSLKYAGGLAESLNAKLMVVTILNERDVRAVENALEIYDASLCEEIIEEKLSDRRRWLNTLVKQANAQAVTKDKIVRIGIPYVELLEIIKSERPDLLIMGTKGRSNMADTIVGSCAQKMYRRCPIPLLSVRPQD